MLHSAATSLAQGNDWRAAFSNAVDAASFYGGAKEGSRTVIIIIIIIIYIYIYIYIYIRLPEYANCIIIHIYNNCE
jgi:hypothetical protein